MKHYTKFNFHKHTFCVFKEISYEKIKEFKFDYISKSGSSYYFTEDGLYRLSNHWGRAANCRWKLDSSSIEIVNSDNKNYKLGFAKWTDFYPNNEQEHLFFIQVNFKTKTVDFHHKLNPNYDGKSICRNSSETTKRIKICKEVLQDENWSKHLNYNSLDILRQEIIQQLIYTDKSFIQIKKNYIL